MSAIISIVMLYFFYKWIFESIFGKSSGSFLSLGSIFSVLKKTAIYFFRFIGWIFKTLFELISLLFKAVFQILKWLFRVLIYNPRM